MSDALMEVYNRAEPVFVRSEGVWLFSEQGEAYLDCVAGIATDAPGHAHPVLIDALKDQAERLWHISNMFPIPDRWIRRCNDQRGLAIVGCLSCIWPFTCEGGQVDEPPDGWRSYHRYRASGTCGPLRIWRRQDSVAARRAPLLVVWPDPDAFPLRRAVTRLALRARGRAAGAIICDVRFNAPGCPGLLATFASFTDIVVGDHRRCDCSGGIVARHRRHFFHTRRSSRPSDRVDCRRRCRPVDLRVAT